MWTFLVHWRWREFTIVTPRNLQSDRACAPATSRKKHFAPYSVCCGHVRLSASYGWCPSAVDYEAELIDSYAFGDFIWPKGKTKFFFRLIDCKIVCVTSKLAETTRRCRVSVHMSSFLLVSSSLQAIWTVTVRTKRLCCSGRSVSLCGNCSHSVSSHTPRLTRSRWPPIWKAAIEWRSLITAPAICKFLLILQLVQFSLTFYRTLCYAVRRACCAAN